MTEIYQDIAAMLSHVYTQHEPSLKRGTRGSVGMLCSRSLSRLRSAAQGKSFKNTFCGLIAWFWSQNLIITIFCNIFYVTYARLHSLILVFGYGKQWIYMLKAFDIIFVSFLHFYWLYINNILSLSLINFSYHISICIVLHMELFLLV